MSAYFPSTLTLGGAHGQKKVSYALVTRLRGYQYNGRLKRAYY